MIIADMTNSKFINTDGRPKYFKIRERGEGLNPWIFKRTFDGTYYSYEQDKWKQIASKKSYNGNYSAIYDSWIIQHNIKEISEKEAFIEIL